MTNEAQNAQIYLAYTAWSSAPGINNSYTRTGSGTYGRVLAIIKIAGGETANNNALYAFDRDLRKKADDATLVEDVTVENLGLDTLSGNCISTGPC